MWYKKLGFRSYPLDPRSNTQLIGVENIERKLKHYINQGNMCLLSGYTGSGKTSMLQKISKSKSMKQFNFVYVSADGVRRDYIIEDAIKQKLPVLSRLLRKKPRNLVIMLDESHLANRLLTESIKSKWNVQYPDGSKAIQSVVVSQIEDRLGTNFSGSFSDRLGKRILIMPKLKGEQLTEVLRQRLDNGTVNLVDRFEEEALELLTKSSDGSVRQVLEYTDAIFTHLDDIEGGNPLKDEEYTITKEAVFNILQASGLVAFDRMNQSQDFQKIWKDKNLQMVVDMFTQFGTLSTIDLAEKMDIKHDKAEKFLNRMLDYQAVQFAHTDSGRDYYVLSPRMQHEVTRV